MKKNKTISAILKSCKVDDILTAKKGQMWQVVDLDYDGCVIAKPYKWKCKKVKSFELWSQGVESIAVIKGLRVKK